MDANEIIIYLRKSQADKEGTIEEVLKKHEEILQNYVYDITGGHYIPDKNIYREIVSGETISARTEMQDVLKKIESDKIKAVLVVDPQRLTRGDLVDCGNILNAFRYSNTKILTPSKSFDLNDKYDLKFLEMELLHGANYLEYCKEIMMRGRNASVAKGNYIGTVPPYGYDKVAYKEGNEKIHTLVVNEKEAEGVKLAFDLYAHKNYTMSAIAKVLDEQGPPPRSQKHWSSAAIHDILNNEVYLGMVRWNWRKVEKKLVDGKIKFTRPKNKDYSLIPGKHPAIISQDTFNKVKERRGLNTRVRKDMGLRNPLAGIIFCQCGRAMSYRTYNKKGRVKAAPRLLCDDQPYCKTKSCFYNDMKNIVIDILKNEISNIAVQFGEIRQAQTSQKTIARLENKLSDLKNKELKLWEKYTEEDMPRHIFDSLIQKNSTEIASAKKALEKARKSDASIPEYTNQLYKFSEALKAFENCSLDSGVDVTDVNNLLKSCIEKLIYSRNNKDEIEVEVFLRQD